MTQSERRFLSALAEEGCALCRWLGLGISPAEIHHIRTGKGVGARASHYETIPLCYEHHRGQTGIHGLGRKRFEREYGVTELELMNYGQAGLRADKRQG